MSGGRARRRKQKAWRQTWRSSVASKFRTCINCGEQGPHFVPPSGGGKMPGFFACEKKESA